jgi:hypothetical protein
MNKAARLHAVLRRNHPAGASRARQVSAFCDPARNSSDRHNNSAGCDRIPRPFKNVIITYLLQKKFALPITPHNRTQAADPLAKRKSEGGRKCSRMRAVARGDYRLIGGRS